MKSFLQIVAMLFLGLLFSCGGEIPLSPEYKKEMQDWDAKRVENLKKESGWLNLVGLYWLEEGESHFGSGNENDIVFPANAPDKLGKFVRTKETVLFISETNAAVLTNGKKVTKIEMKIDLSGDPTILESGSLRWFIIQRGEQIGIRLRDLNADLVKNFKGIERFTVDPKWRINAKFTPYAQPKEVFIPTILGTIEQELSPGKLIFNIEGKEFSFEPTSAGKGLFVVFADLTSGDETYGAGRFLYIDSPDSNNNVILDFNKAYNPPCAFTKYATCPLPPEENKVRVRITAGERKFDEGH